MSLYRIKGLKKNTTESNTKDMEIGVMLCKNKKSYILQWQLTEGITMMIMKSLKKETFLLTKKCFNA